jgi:ABC-type transport system involved in multi-copper enzyme maturation permease subunit
VGLMFVGFGAAPPKIVAIAQATYRETIRQPLFWLLVVLFLCFMLLSVFLPYFTLGEDLKMMKDLQLDAILIPCLILTVFTASVSIAEEIEGRTAITVMSKPVSRRQFLLGKYFGILLAALLMAAILAVFMGWTINFKIDQSPSEVERPGDPDEIVAMQRGLRFLPSQVVGALRYLLLVIQEIENLAPGIVLGFCQVAILTAVAVALATRLPMVVNLVVCLVVFFMGRLTHILEAKSQNTLVKFVAQVFDNLLPGLNYYDINPAIVTDIQIPWAEYVLPAAVHGLIYTGIVLLFGLILFEDRDLA